MSFSLYSHRFTQEEVGVTVQRETCEAVRLGNGTEDEEEEPSLDATDCVDRVGLTEALQIPLSATWRGVRDLQHKQEVK